MFEDIRNLKNAIRYKRELIEELRSRATSATMSLDGDRVQYSGSKDRIGELMCKIVILEKELAGMESDYAMITGEALTNIYAIGNDEWADILYTHYLEFKSLQEIANAKGVSLNAIRAKNNRALKKYKCIIDETK